MHPVPRVCANEKCSQVFFIKRPCEHRRKYCSRSCNSISNWQDPKFKAKISAARKLRWQDPKFKAKMSKIHKENWQDPELRSKMSKIQKEIWQDPDYKKKMRKARTTDKCKKILRITNLYTVLCRDFVKELGKEDELKKLARLIVEQEMKDAKHESKT